MVITILRAMSLWGLTKNAYLCSPGAGCLVGQTQRWNKSGTRAVLDLLQHILGFFFRKVQKATKITLGNGAQLVITWPSSNQIPMPAVDCGPAPYPRSFLVSHQRNYRQVSYSSAVGVVMKAQEYPRSW